MDDMNWKGLGKSVGIVAVGLGVVYTAIPQGKVKTILSENWEELNYPNTRSGKPLTIKLSPGTKCAVDSKNRYVITVPEGIRIEGDQETIIPNPQALSYIPLDMAGKLASLPGFDYKTACELLKLNVSNVIASNNPQK